jgi:Tfp pilus assembly protein FimV
MTDDKKPVVREEKPVVKEPAPVAKKSRLDELMELREKKDKEISAISLLISQKQVELSALQQEVGMLNTQVERLRPDDGNQDAIRAYLESQAKLRESGMAPIDASRMRMKRRGTQRLGRSMM